MITSWPPISVPDWYVAVARGQVGDASVVNIYGYQEIVGTTVIPLWENPAAYVYPPAAITMTLYSSSASDTAVSVFINGLDASFNPISETLVLTNGTTGVNTVNQYYRVNNISVTGANNAVGTIYLSNTAKTVTYSQINLTGGVSAGRSQSTVYTVPNGYTFYLTRVNGYATPTNNAFRYYNYRVWTRNITTGIITILQEAPFVNTYQTLRVAPRGYAGKTDIQWQVGTSSDVGSVSIGVEGILIKGT